jgi:DNA-binding response OmpR family regulator
MQQFEKLKNKTILLVEDERIVRENVASMLKLFFKEVYTAIDGYDGLDKYENYLPDIIMTDLKMPNMGGFELLDELEKRACKSYIIIASAYSDTDFLIKAIHSKVDRYLIKPITQDEFLESFEAYLKKIEQYPQNVELEPNIFFDLNKNQMILNEQKIHLNKKESLFMKLLCSDINKTFSYEEIEYQVWGASSMSLSAIRSVVRDLRKKIGQDYIVNISGLGYRLK